MTPSPLAEKPQPRPRLSRASWVGAAREALIDGGSDSVKVEVLADRLGVTTGSFYWHFKNRAALLAALLDDWRQVNTAAMAEAVEHAGSSAADQFDALAQVWISEAVFSPAYDAAIRDWARTSDEVAAALHRVDRERIDLIRGIFLGLGYDPDRAEVRARILYFHQVGYYALQMSDDLETRLKLRPLYIEALRDGPGKGEFG